MREKSVFLDVYENYEGKSDIYILTSLKSFCNLDEFERKLDLKKNQTTVDLKTDEPN